MSYCKWLCIVLAGVLLSSCARYLSEGSLRLVNQEISFSMVKENPDHYRGSYLLVGGKIAKVTNGKEGGEIEVVQVNVDGHGRPLDDFRNSAGRFLALTGYFVDPAIYQEGMVISMVGQVKGKREKPLDAVTYSYPLLEVQELYLWQPEELYREDDLYTPYPYSLFPYDSLYRYGWCDYGWGPFPYSYDYGWRQGRCYPFDHYGVHPPLFRRPRHRPTIITPPATGKPEGSPPPGQPSPPVAGEPDGEKGPPAPQPVPAPIEPPASRSPDPPAVSSPPLAPPPVERHNHRESAAPPSRG